MTGGRRGRSVSIGDPEKPEARTYFNSMLALPFSTSPCLCDPSSSHWVLLLYSLTSGYPLTFKSKHHGRWRQ